MRNGHQLQHHDIAKCGSSGFASGMRELRSFPLVLLVLNGAFLCK